MACARSPSYFRGWGGKLSWAQEVEAAASCDPATALQPLIQKKKKERKKIEATSNTGMDKRLGHFHLPYDFLPNFLSPDKRTTCLAR